MLNVALTRRNHVPMCGVPYHAAQNYVAKLIKAGKRVAICDQISEPQPGKIVTRDITQIITAGTVSELNLLEAKRPNYLGAIYVEEGSTDSPMPISPPASFGWPSGTAVSRWSMRWPGFRLRNCW